MEGPAMIRRLSLFGIALLAAVIFIHPGKGLLAQEIQIKMEDGIPVVYNPKEPVQVKGQPSKLILKEDLTIGKDTDDTDYMFSGLQHAQVDEEGYMYAADWKEILIKVYDKNGQHVRSFGRKGQGPGEIGIPAYLGIFQGDKVVIFDRPNGKFIFFNRDGELLNEVPLGKNRSLTRFAVDSEGCFYSVLTSFDGTKVTGEFKKFSPAFEPLATFASFDVKRTPQVIPAFSPPLFIRMTREENLVWLDPFHYALTIFSREGKVLRKIIKDCEPMKISEADRQRLVQEIWGDQGIRPGYKFDVPKHFPPVRSFYVDDENRIYVWTYEYITKEGNPLMRYDVFDPEGRYMAKFYHPRVEGPQAFRKNKMYVRVEEEVYGMDCLRRYGMIWE
jgi:hypothetical protein